MDLAVGHKYNIMSSPHLLQGVGKYKWILSW